MLPAMFAIYATIIAITDIVLIVMAFKKTKSYYCIVAWGISVVTLIIYAMFPCFRFLV